MGDVDSVGAQDSTTGRVARFYLDRPYYLSWARVHFAGSGTGTATLTLKVDSQAGPNWDATLRTWTGAGVSSAAGDADVFFRVPEDELVHYLFQANDEGVFEWTNPDSGNIIWGIEVGLIDAAQFNQG